MRRAAAIITAILILAAGGLSACGRNGGADARSERSDAENTKDLSEITAAIPDYSGEVCIAVNNDKPDPFGPYEASDEGTIILSDLDSYGRAGSAMMIAGPNTIQTGERGPTGRYKPSGWVQHKYPGVVDSDPPYLMNRAHLLMWYLSGLTDTEENLISATNYMNTEGMLPVELEICRYIRSGGGCVAYRVTPVYEGNNLLASGVLMEAAAIDGTFCLCRYVYNVQPGVEIDYATGENHLAEDEYDG